MVELSFNKNILLHDLEQACPNLGIVQRLVHQALYEKFTKYVCIIPYNLVEILL